MKMVRYFFPVVGSLLAFCLTTLAGAAELPAYQLPAGAPADGQLVANHAGTVRTFSLAEIETLPMVEVDGRTSPDEPVTRFQGVLLKDVLRLIGADAARQVTVRASDNYAAEIPREDLERWPVVFATRTAGKPLTTRQRGPARIIYPNQIYPELKARVYDDRGVWLISEIEW